MAKRATTDFSDFEQHIHERLDKAYRRVFGGTPSSPNFGVPYMEPPVDVYQTEAEVVVLMEIAGIPEEEIEIRAEGRTMLIRGERKPLPGPRGRTYSQMEIPSGPFQREILLPAPVNPDAAQATYKNGILQIVLPKADPVGGTHLRIVIR